MSAPRSAYSFWFDKYTGRVRQRQDRAVVGETVNEQLVDRIFAGETVTIFAPDAPALHALLRERTKE